jgi:hypothetical protein
MSSKKKQLRQTKKSCKKLSAKNAHLSEPDILLSKIVKTNEIQLSSEIHKKQSIKKSTIKSTTINAAINNAVDTTLSFVVLFITIYLTI